MRRTNVGQFIGPDFFATDDHRDVDYLIMDLV